TARSNFLVKSTSEVWSFGKLQNLGNQGDGQPPVRKVLLAGLGESDDIRIQFGLSSDYCNSRYFFLPFHEACDAEGGYGEGRQLITGDGTDKMRFFAHEFMKEAEDTVSNQIEMKMLAGI